MAAMSFLTQERIDDRVLKYHSRSGGFGVSDAYVQMDAFHLPDGRLISAGWVGRTSRRIANNADLEATITALLEGQYSHPVRIVAFNTA